MDRPLHVRRDLRNLRAASEQSRIFESRAKRALNNVPHLFQSSPKASPSPARRGLSRGAGEAGKQWLRPRHPDPGEGDAASTSYATLPCQGEAIRSVESALGAPGEI
jgi:hypothetical protein